MPNRLSKLFSSSDKEKEALAEAERNVSSSSSTKDAPPSYEQQQSYDQENTLAPPDMTAGFSNLKISNTGDGFPTKAECIAHLKTLECFYRLKQSIAAQDGLYDIRDSIVTSSKVVQNDKTPEVLAKLGEKRWAIYVQQAVERFEAWWKAIRPNSLMADLTRLETEGKQGKLCDLSKSKAFLFDDSTAPPADVLMVWHAYMLNPRCYLEDCIRQGKLDIWHTSMPWEVVARSINSETFAYEATPAARTHFTELTGIPWEGITDSKTRPTLCPTCSTLNYVPWTTRAVGADYFLATTQSELEAEIDDYLSDGYGYCDQGLRHACTTCSRYITHDRLRIAKFANDVARLQVDNVPMSGTILGLQGISWKAHGQKDPTTVAISSLPNQMIKIGSESPFNVRDLGTLEVFSEVRGLIEATIKDKKHMRMARGSLSHTIQRTERIAIRKMMSRYWENSSPFALDLLGAVIRQGSFIEKMHNIDWLHSPALPSTMDRLVWKYENFMTVSTAGQIHLEFI